jgi:hypothetical protein
VAAKGSDAGGGGTVDAHAEKAKEPDSPQREGDVVSELHLKKKQKKAQQAGRYTGSLVERRRAR